MPGLKSVTPPKLNHLNHLLILSSAISFPHLFFARTALGIYPSLFHNIQQIRARCNIGDIVCTLFSRPLPSLNGDAYFGDLSILLTFRGPCLRLLSQRCCCRTSDFERHHVKEHVKDMTVKRGIARKIAKILTPTTWALATCITASHAPNAH